MGVQDRQDHQPEPWTQDGRYILDASGWTLASARFPADARRIVAAINAVQGVPTDALESWSVKVIGELAAEKRPESADTESFRVERRVSDRRQVSDRRRGDRRATRPETRIVGAPTFPENGSEGKNR